MRLQMNDPCIRPTQPDDAVALQGVVARTGLFPDHLLPAMMREGLADRHLWLTATRAGVPSGFCFARPEEMAEGSWNMLALAVDPRFQRRGVARALVLALEARLASDHQRLIVVDTADDPATRPARALYNAVGYMQVGNIPDFWALGVAKITFAKRLR